MKVVKSVLWTFFLITCLFYNSAFATGHMLQIDNLMHIEKQVADNTTDKSQILTFDENALERLRSASKMIVSDIPLTPAKSVSVELNRFSVVGPETQYSANLDPSLIPKFDAFYGTIDDDDDSWVFMAVSDDKVYATFEQAGERYILQEQAGNDTNRALPEKQHVIYNEKGFVESNKYGLFDDIQSICGGAISSDRVTDCNNDDPDTWQMLQFNIAVETDNQFFNDFRNTPENQGLSDDDVQVKATAYI